ncbi:MAG: EAL domain-containing protein [Pseudomonadota bacterium]|nr:EAL domain-containing protein [Pseudomonadota bacterium]
MNFLARVDRDPLSMYTPELEAIVSAEVPELIAIRAVPGMWSARAIDRVSSAASSIEDTLWRLASDRDRRRASLFRAARAGWRGPVHVQIMAASADDCEVCSMALVADARAAGIKPERIVLEISETEEVEDAAKLALATALWRSLGFRTATRNFGAGLSGLAMLLRLEPDLVCLDGDWVRRVSIDQGTRIIIAGVVNTCRELGCAVIADGVVSERLSQTLIDLGIDKQSGPLFEHLAAALPDS